MRIFQRIGIVLVIFLFIVLAIPLELRAEEETGQQIDSSQEISPLEEEGVAQGENLSNIQNEESNNDVEKNSFDDNTSDEIREGFYEENGNVYFYEQGEPIVNQNKTIRRFYADRSCILSAGQQGCQKKAAVPAGPAVRSFPEGNQEGQYHQYRAG